jgi:ABC-type nitrate/sulfonate/bicarbonate transport system substrate-binding protein
MTVTLTLNTFSEPSLLIAARHAGYLEREGIATDVVQAKGSRPQMQGLLAGDWDLVHTNADNVMKFRGQGHDQLFIFMVADLGISQKLVVSPDIRSWEDLRGKPIGVDAPDSGYAFVVYELLARHGLPAGSYEVKPLGATAYRLEGLRSGEAVAGLLSHHHETNALDEGFVILADTREHFPEFPGVTAAATRQWAEEHEDLLHGYTRGLLGASRWAQDPANTDEVVALMARARGVPEAEARRLLDNEQSARTGPVPSPEQAAASLQAVAELRAKATGTLPEGYFDERYMRAALEALGTR